MKIAVSSHGCEWAAKNMACHLRGMGAEFVNRPERAELRLLIGYYFHNGEEVQRSELMAAKRRVIWWVGTDLLWMEAQGPNSERVKWINQNVRENWAEWDHSAARLKTLGIKQVKMVHMPTRFRYEPLPLPAEFAVGCYCYDSRQDFYGIRLIQEAARLSPEIVWKVYPRRRKGRRGNLEEMLRVPPEEMIEVYRQMSVHVRIVQADGMPQGPMEAMMCGRPVIYNYRAMPYLEYLPKPTPESLVELVRSIRGRQSRGEMGLGAAQYWFRENDPEKLRAEVARIQEGI